MKVLFICTGNICRSPMAEAVMRHKAKLQGLDIVSDSAGLIGYHVGEDADRRTLRVLRKHGIDAPSKARQFSQRDLEAFDHFFAMDRTHLLDLRNRWDLGEERATLFRSWDEDAFDTDVPDPYYGDERDFEAVYEMVDSGTDALLRAIADGRVLARDAR